MVKAVRAVWEHWEEKPLFVRFSASDWAEGPEKDSDGKWLQWVIDQSILLAGELKKLGVDLNDVSSGGNWVAQKIPVRPGYQVRGHANWRHDNMITPVLIFLAGSVRGGNQEGASGHPRGHRGNDHDFAAGE